jgi:hypothetical protein
MNQNQLGQTATVQSEQETLSRLERIGRLRSHLTDIMPDAETMWRTQPTVRQGWRHRRQQATQNHLVFRGHLAVDSDQA